MKKFLIALCILSLPSLAMANNTGLYGAYWDTDSLDTGYGGGGKVQFDLGSAFAVDIRASYIDFSDIDLQVIPLEGTLLLRLPLGGTLTPYGGLGGGFYMFEADKVDPDDGVGWYFLGGLSMQLQDNLSLFGEIRYFNLEADTDAALDSLKGIDDDLDFDGFGVNVGLGFAW